MIVPQKKGKQNIHDLVLIGTYCLQLNFFVQCIEASIFKNAKSSDAPT
jgi:hypothetical protein